MKPLDRRLYSALLGKDVVAYGMRATPINRRGIVSWKSTLFIGDPGEKHPEMVEKLKNSGRPWEIEDIFCLASRRGTDKIIVYGYPKLKGINLAYDSILIGPEFRRIITGGYLLPHARRSHIPAICIKDGSYDETNPIYTTF